MATGCPAFNGDSPMAVLYQVLNGVPTDANNQPVIAAATVKPEDVRNFEIGLKTRAMREGNHYVVNGQKVWTSRARHSDLMLLLARTTPIDEVKRRTDGLSVFLINLRENLGKGVEIRPIEAMINHNTTEVFFDNLKVPPDAPWA